MWISIEIEKLLIASFLNQVVKDSQVDITTARQEVPKTVSIY
jgi:hypothetical protein